MDHCLQLILMAGDVIEPLLGSPASRPRIKEELQLLIRLAVPCMVTTLAQQLMVRV